MKVGKISFANKKGQLVIPKKYRDELGITDETPLHIVKNEAGLLIYPLAEVPVPSAKQWDKKAYEHLLVASQGAWGDEGWQEGEERQRDVELKATREGKKEW